ncbi:MAG: T9SS type A sorting domain-containing protein [Bacteroidetes bacterium]|nr:T9SS type A sorting domain-containing protein [Bacteroidota bacterium]
MIREIATQEENTLGKIQSQNVLHLVYGDTFPVLIDEEEIYLRQLQHSQGKVEITNVSELQLYPNPTTELVEIKLNNSKEYLEQIIVLNSLGNVVLIEKLTEKENKYNLNTSHLPPGLYLVKVNATSGKIFSNKLMIVK